MKNYSAPFPTIRDLIKDKDYDYVEYRIYVEDLDKDYFAGMFEVKNGEIINIDDDVYELDDIVFASDEWSNPEKGVERGLTIIVNEDYGKPKMPLDEEIKEQLKRFG